MRAIDVAKTMLGWHELDKRQSLKLFFKKAKIVLDPFTTPWCAAFVNACLAAVNLKGTGLVNARSFLTWGIKVDEDEAEEGDVIIFTRGGSTWQGHVAFFVEWEDDRGLVKVLGGNQSDKVCYAFYAQDRILGIRRK